MTKVFIVDDIELSSMTSLSMSSSMTSITPGGTSNERERGSDVSVHDTIEIISEPQEIQSEEEKPSESNLVSEKNFKVSATLPSSSQLRPNAIFTIEEYSNRSDNEQEVILTTSLDLEETLHKKQANERNETFKSIILNNQVDFSWRELLYYTFGPIIIGFAATTPYSLIPAHDLIQYPEYWYEILFHGPYITFFGYAYRCLFQGLFMNIQYLKTNRVIFLQSIIGFAEMFTYLLFTYYIWTRILSYQYPMPFLGLTTVYVNSIFYFIEIWALFPKEWRQNSGFKRRMKNFIFEIGLRQLMVVLYSIIVLVLRKYPNQYQPLIALSLPFLRESWIWLSMKLALNSANGDVSGATIALKYRISLEHTITLCTTIGTIATEATSWVLIGVDFSFNIYLVLQIVWLNKRHPDNVQTQIDTLQDLALYELVEFQAPLVYFGPNGNLFGNILNSYWTYTAIENINETLMGAGKIFIADFSSTLLCAVILWGYCRINLWKAILQLQKEFAKNFIACVAWYLVIVSAN